MKGSKCLTVILATTLLLTGCGLLLYPTANKLWRDHAMHRDAEEFLAFVETRPDNAGSPDFPDLEQDTEESIPDQYPELWLAMNSYNESLFASKQMGLSTPAAYETPVFTLADYGLDTEVFGVLSIPKLGLEMPLYLGASKENMTKGAAILGQTSLPIGGSNTNCVIAGHRGWNGAAYFLYVPTLEIGDTVTITNLWETLTYRVVETKIIFPDDVEAIGIQPGRELLTLLTCHPPATGGRQRFLVFCERDYEMEVS